MDTDEIFTDDVVAEEFTVEDHHVIWANADDTDYPVWFCETHKKHYYRDCI